MRKIRVHVLAIATALLGMSAAADTLVEQFGDTHAGLPDYLQFDCSSSEAGQIEVFGQRMRIPRNFHGGQVQVHGAQGASLDWSIPLADGLFTVYYASISAGSIEGALDKFGEYPTVSTPSENTIGVYVKISETALGEVGESHSITLLFEDEYLIASSLVPMDWQSLLDCFEPENANHSDSTDDKAL